MFSSSPENKILNRMGYISDQQGILNRYFREKEGWAEHLINTKEFILECLAGKEVNKLIVLGSGWLLDFPLEKLYSQIKKISLIDIYHPPQVIKKVKNFPGVECISADITGGYIRQIYDKVNECKKHKTEFSFDDNITIPVYSGDENDYIISLNILNQLDILLTDYIKSQIKVSDNSILQIRKKLQKDHINFLSTTKYILITDSEEIIINNQGEKESSKNLLYSDLPLSDYSKEWSWRFDNSGLYNPKRQTHMNVRALYSESPIIHYI